MGFVQQKSGSIPLLSNTVDVLFDTPATASNSIILLLSIYATDTLDGDPIILSGGGESLIAVASHAGSSTYSLIYYLHNLNGGETGVRVSITGAIGAIGEASFNISEWSNLINASPDIVVENSGNDNNPILPSIAPNTGNNLLIGLASWTANQYSSGADNSFVRMSPAGRDIIWQEGAYRIQLADSSSQSTQWNLLVGLDWTTCGVAFDFDITEEDLQQDDSATGTDTKLLLGSTSKSDTGTGTETETLSGTTTKSDTSSGTDTKTLSADILSGDSSVGSESILTSPAFSNVDSSVGLDSFEFEETQHGYIAPDLIETIIETPSRISGYQNVSTLIREAIKRNSTYYIGIEFYLPNTDEIYAEPEKAVFVFSSSRFKWRNRVYRDNVKSIPELKKFIGKTFNTFSMNLANVELGKNRASNLVFKNLIRGYRVAVRIIFPDLPETIDNSRLVWWGRIVKSDSISEENVSISCSQEVGNFSYEVCTQSFGSTCPLFFGRGDCLGNQTLEQKSLLFQEAFNTFGQGGCNRTAQRCDQLGNSKLYQGQRIVTIQGQFFRESFVKSGWWIFKRSKKILTPVQFSSHNQDDGNNIIPKVYGRAQVLLKAITWADIGTEIIALMAASKGEIGGFFNIICRNVNLTISSVTQHLGELGGIGTQQPDPRFPSSGFNSKLAYIGITFSGSPPSDEAEDAPAVTAIEKGTIIETPDITTNGFKREWSYNPVWITRDLLLNFPYTVVKAAWLNENKNKQTADYCFTIVEDDTGAEIPILSAASFANYNDERFNRFRSVSRFSLDNLENNRNVFSRQNVGSNPLLPDPDPDPTGGGDPPDDVPPTEPPHRQQLIGVDWNAAPDVIFGNGLDFGTAALQNLRTYLQYRYTCNGVIKDTVKLSDLLFSLILPTFKGFLRFNQFGQIEIDCRKPVDNTFIRGEQLPIGGDTAPDIIPMTEIAVANVKKFSESYGYLLIGVGLSTSEISKIKGIRYVNGSALTDVQFLSNGSIHPTYSQVFVSRASAPAEVIVDFTGQVEAGKRLQLIFTEPNGDILEWDYYVDSDTDSLELIVKMFQVRLMASPAFKESWTAEVFPELPLRLYIRCQTGYIKLDRPLKNRHYIGEEILRVIEVYEDAKDAVDIDGIKDNIKDFGLNDSRSETFHGVSATYISAVQDFAVTNIRPRIAWDAAEEERNLNLLELDLSFVDNYRQAAFLAKAATIQFVDGNLPASITTGIMGLFHEENEVIAVRHQTMEGISYTPFTIEDISYSHENQTTSLVLRIYLSAMFDERVAKEEKFLESTLTSNADPSVTPAPILSAGGYSSTRTGDGAGDRANDIKYETRPYETFPGLQKYSPNGRDN